MLTGEPSLVSMSAALLEAMLEHNSASLATLYQTGIFFFALAYCGSNLVETGRLFKVWASDNGTQVSLMCGTSHAKQRQCCTLVVIGGRYCKTLPEDESRMLQFPCQGVWRCHLHLLSSYWLYHDGE